MKRPTHSHPAPLPGGPRPAPRRPVPPGAAAGAGRTAAAEPEAATLDGEAPPTDADPPAPAPPAPRAPAPAAAADGRAAGPGSLLAGRYRLERKLGAGGMGSVFLATQIAVDRKVAVKILENVSDDGVTVARFQREARVIAQLQHPNIVNLIDFGATERGQLYLVMEYIDGEPLSALIKREAPLPAARVIAIALQILDALAAAHGINVVHRDLIGNCARRIRTARRRADRCRPRRAASARRRGCPRRRNRSGW